MSFSENNYQKIADSFGPHSPNTTPSSSIYQSSGKACPPPNQNSKKTKNQTQLYPDTKKEQREELCNKYFLLHCQKDEVFIISATGELFDKEDLWTDKRKQLISPIVLGNLIHDIER